MILLKKPYTPVVFTSATKTFNVYGISLYKITNVYLSGYPYENTTFYNPFSGVPKLSANYPGFYGVKLLSSAYTSNNQNTINFIMPSATRSGYVDIIVENLAGYGTLTQYAVKETYSNTQPLSSINPWAQGIIVKSAPDIILPDTLLYTFSGLSGIYTFDGKGIMTFGSTPVTEIITLNNNFLITIDGNSIITI
jgi:hypothetical protein